MTWWLWLSVVYMVSYAGSVRIILQRGWVADTDSFRRQRSDGIKVMMACSVALLLAFIWPAVLVATIESPSDRAARKRRELMERQCEEASALAAREKALGLRSLDDLRPPH